MFTALGLIPAVDLTIEIDITITAGGEQLVIDVMDVRVEATPAPAAIDELLGLVGGAVGVLFPITVPVELPGGDPDVCDIGLRSLAAGFLGGTPGATDPCLAVLTGLLPDSATNLGALASPLPAGTDGGVFLDNFFLLTKIACDAEHSPQLHGLAELRSHVPVRTDAAPFFEWSGAEITQEVNGQQIVIIRVRLDIDGANPADKAFVVTADLKILRRLFTVDVTVVVPVGLSFDEATGEIVPVIDQDRVVVDVTIQLTGLGLFVAVAAGAVLALVTGGVVGLISGITAALVAGAVNAGIYAVIVVLIVQVIKKVVGNAVTKAVAEQSPARVQVIPQPIVDLFGVLDIAELVFDDLQLTGTLTLADPGLALDHVVVHRQTKEIGNGLGGRVFHIATTVRFDAQPRRLTAPVSYQWRFARRAGARAVGVGAVLGSGSVPPGSGISRVDVAGNTCRITNAFGSDMDGTVSVRATDAAGRTFTRSAPLRLTGSMTIPIDDLPDRKPDPLFPEQP